MLKALHSALPLQLCRLITTTTALRRQPPHDKQRYKRHHPEPRHTMPFIDEAPLDHLPRRSPTPTGLWGSTSAVVKAQRFKHEQQLKQVATTFEKLQELYHLEQNLWYHSLDLPLQHPEMLEFCQQLTRTNVMYPWEPDLAQEYPLAQEYMAHAVSECLLQLTRLPINTVDTNPEAVLLRNRERGKMIAAYMEAFHQAWLRMFPQSHVAHVSECLQQLNRLPINTVDTNPEAVLLRNRERGKMIAAYMEAFHQAWLRMFPQSHVARRPYQLDERGTIETFLKRKVPPEMFSKYDDIAEDIFDEVNETVFDTKEETVRYRIRSELACQLRGIDPLRPFLSWDDPLCLENRVPTCNYRPEAFELKPVDCYEFSCLPHTETLDFSEFARSVAGFWPRSPFWEGDPCEFGHVGVLDVARSEKLLRDLSKSQLPVAVIQEVRVRHALSEGLLTAFAWTSAQAYNQGFWPRSPFWEGDPCEFGHVGVLDVARSEKLLRDLSKSQLPVAVIQEVRVRHALSEGLLTAFAWTSAQAYNQGFTLYNELTYPLATQLLLVDNDHIQLLRYQLNSLTSLWKADDSGLPFNMAWLSPKVKLYELNPDIPTKVSINPRAIALMASAMTYPVDENLSSEYLRPYLKELCAPRDRAQPTGDPSTYLIPDSCEESPEELSDSPPPVMSKLEKEALEISKQADRETPHRIFGHPRPHPNDVFFLKMTDKSELVQELKDEMPDFGGQFSCLPEPHNSRIKEFKIERRNRQPRLRVQAPPRRWR
ncbi:hypothetical protein T265_00970 [Opisthorchis viverrini]|uniref:28S ribosomal protein S30, mitochondrial n=1 Tax=Opisthorchis viverrini TaxID=6198 RepID=A0A075A459_OPIVI|nr:hypothetical protein T265_00970 [Opisthorchis viverrini]KER33072.1 hypothetical protein T265_00970 [Opisthorchis viverrini]